MSNPAGGRPKNAEGRRPTSGVRVFKDLGDKLKDLKELKDTTYADILDPMIRIPVEDEWQENQEGIEQMRALDAQKDEVRKQAKAKKAKKKK